MPPGRPGKGAPSASRRPAEIAAWQGGHSDEGAILRPSTRVLGLAGAATGAVSILAIAAAGLAAGGGPAPDDSSAHGLRAANRALRAELRRERAARPHSGGLRREAPAPRDAVEHAIALGAAAFGQSPDRLRRVALCESTLDPAAANGPYAGLFQFGAPLWNRTPFRDFERTDPYAAAFAASWAFARGWDTNWPVCSRR